MQKEAYFYYIFSQSNGQTRH